MGFHQFRREQELPLSLERAWAFLSNPVNLQKITPGEMGFEILTPDLPEKIYPGMIIAYRVGLLPGWRSTWVSEITQVEEGRYFVDEQRIGPYAMWHHQHLLESRERGVLMTDIVSYKPPFGPFGELARLLFIRRRLEEIFDYRERALAAEFSSS